MMSPEPLPNRPDGPLQTQLANVLAANYELDDEIGRGGMGIVYRARDKRLKRTVAVKLLPPELAFRSDIRSRFLREAATSAQLSHPNIVPIYTVDDTDNLVFFIMGYVSGSNLATYLREHGPMRPEEARRVLREVAEALAYAHSRRVIHRDIKPDNILLDMDSGRAMVTDFGIARAVSESTDTQLTSTGVAIGTPAYMSPEQSAADRDIDGRSDLYSLGVVGYQLLCGEPPFVAPSTPAMLMKQMAETPRPLRERCSVPDDLNAIIMRCLAKNPDDRFASAEVLISALDGKETVLGPVAQTAVGKAARDGGSATTRGSTPPLQYTGAATQTPGAMPVPVVDQSANEVLRWEAAPVQKFRRQLVKFFLTGIVLLVLGIFGSHGFFFFCGIWAAILAARYAKLWEQGYDWRDVFRRQRDTLFMDVVSERIDEAKALFDPAMREETRQRARERMRMQPGLFAQSSSILEPSANTTSVRDSVPPLTREIAAQLPVVQEAAAARIEIHRLMVELPKDDRAMLPDVSASADALFARIEVLAANADELKRVNVPGVSEAVEQEITSLENEANPFDEERSERRVRRLAQLRRQRISLRDMQQRYDQTIRNLDRCVTAMRSMRVDLIRLRTGGQSYASVTQIAEQAMQLGNEVDAVLYANDEVSRVLRRDS